MHGLDPAPSFPWKIAQGLCLYLPWKYLQKWEVQSFRILRSLCTAGRHHPTLSMAMQMNPAVQPREEARNGPGGAVGLHLQSAPRSASLALGLS